jgi:hypothetical protein
MGSTFYPTRRASSGSTLSWLIGGCAAAALGAAVLLAVAARPPETGLAAHHARLRQDPLLSSVVSEGPVEGVQAIGALRVLLRDRGFGPDVTAGPMIALPPGAAVYGARPAPDDEMEALVTPYQPEAWLVRTDAGRWWLWESGAAAPADLQAEVHQLVAELRARDEGRILD